MDSQGVLLLSGNVIKIDASMRRGFEVLLSDIVGIVIKFDVSTRRCFTVRKCN